MILASLIFATIAALLHVYIFTMESITWTKPKTWKTFSITSQADAETTKPLAYNQGFYNLFLAIGALIGIIAVGHGCTPSGLDPRLQQLRLHAPGRPGARSQRQKVPPRSNAPRHNAAARRRAWSVGRNAGLVAD